MACTIDGVRIPSATLSSSAATPPTAQTTTSGSSFQTVLANASTEGRPEPRSTSHVATSPVGERAEDRSADEADTESTGSVAPESSTVAGPGGERLQGTTDPTEANASLAPAGQPATAQPSTEVSAAVESSSDAYLRQSAVGASTGDAVIESSASDGADVPSVNNSPARLPGKQDRPKAQTDLKPAGMQTVAVVAAADPSRVPVVNVVSWQGTGHGRGSEASGSAEKNTAPENSAGNNGKTAAPLDAANDGPASAAIVAGGATGLEQGVLPQAPADAFEAGLDLSMTSGLSGTSELTSPTDVGLPSANFLQKGASAVDGSGSSKTTDGASNTKSVAAGGVDTSSHAASDSQIAQNAQGDASKAGVAVVVPKATESGAIQSSMQTLLTPAVSHGTANAQHGAAATPDAAHTGMAQHLAASTHVASEEVVAASGINSARLIQTMGETEMHVGMHSAEFGDISIRTSLSQQQMVMQISLDHNDLSQAISAHLSTVQAKLGEEYGLHASIEINNQGAPLSGGQGNSSQRDQQTFGRSSQGESIALAGSIENVAGVVAQAGAGSGHGLDITV